MHEYGDINPPAEAHIPDRRAVSNFHSEAPFPVERPMHTLHLSSTLACTSTTLRALLGNLWCTGTDGLSSGLLLLLVSLLGLRLGDGSLSGSSSDFGLSGTFGEDRSKVGTDNTTLKISQILSEQKQGTYLDLDVLPAPLLGYLLRDTLLVHTDKSVHGPSFSYMEWTYRL